MELAQSVITPWEFEFYLNNIDKRKLTQKQQQTRETTVVHAASTPPTFSEKRQPTATREKARNSKLWFSGN